MLRQAWELDEYLEKRSGDFTEFGLAELPGVALKSFTVHKNTDWWSGAPEPYLVGVCIDGNKTISTFPVGIGDFDKASADIDHIKTVRVGETVTYPGQGELIFPPPAMGFLSIRLLFVDSDGGVRRAAKVLKEIGEVVTSDDVIDVLKATANLNAVGAAITKALDLISAGAQAAMANKRDELIDEFRGTFIREDFPVVDGRTDAWQPITLNQEGITAVFQPFKASTDGRE